MNELRITADQFVATDVKEHRCLIVTDGEAGVFFEAGYDRPLASGPISGDELTHLIAWLTAKRRDMKGRDDE